MTLTEVIAGLVLLVTVLAAVGIARGRFIRQWSDADRTLLATRAADVLLADWMSGPPGRVPVGYQGVLEGVDGCRWAVIAVSDRSAERLGARRVRMEVSRVTDSDRRTAAQTVLTVDFLLPEDLPPVASGGER